MTEIPKEESPYSGVLIDLLKIPPHVCAIATLVAVGEATIGLDFSGSNHRKLEVILPEQTSVHDDEQPRVVYADLKSRRAEMFTTTSSQLQAFSIIIRSDGAPVYVGVDGPPNPLVTVYSVKPPADKA